MRYLYFIESILIIPTIFYRIMMIINYRNKNRKLFTMDIITAILNCLLFIKMSFIFTYNYKPNFNLILFIILYSLSLLLEYLRIINDNI